RGASRTDCGLPGRAHGRGVIGRAGGAGGRAPARARPGVRGGADHVVRRPMSGAGARAERSADVELRGLHKRYGAVVAVESLDLRAEPGEFVSLLAPSGCGKTTTLRAIAGLTPPDRGLVIRG